MYRKGERPKTFSICAIEIYKDCIPAIRKILTPGIYRFNDWLDSRNRKSMQTDKFKEEFFGRHISVQVIVGKNGTGKSTLLDIIYALINNFSVEIEKNENRPAAENLTYLDGLHATLYFMLGTEVGTLTCNHQQVLFKIGSIIYDNQKDRIDNRLNDIAHNFFYTIVTNYSMQGFISSDYAIRADDTHEKSKVGVAWIDGLFHKNDGYMTPLVLNPYRDNGVINFNREYDLTLYRLSAILIDAQRTKSQFIEDYELAEIRYTFNIDKLFRKIRELLQAKERKPTENHHDSRKISTVSSPEEFLKYFKETTTRSSCISSEILKAYHVKNGIFSDEIMGWCAVYLVYKTLNIARTYPNYQEFGWIGSIADWYEVLDEEGNYAGSIRALVSQIQNDPSHITIKIRQTLNMLSKRLSLRRATWWQTRSFTYTEYRERCHLSGYDLNRIMETMPPPVFSYKLYLRQPDQKPIINFRKLSSGERQFAYTMTTIFYHILNILSVPFSGERPAYRHINIIMDEVEICFHPEMQRKFIFDFVSTIKRLKLNQKCAVNIILATHSPFILSDVPKSNILYLKKNERVQAEDFENPFGANINDILAQSFFLDKGFTGEFARQKIQSLIDFLCEEKFTKDWNPTRADRFIRLIGEPILRKHLLMLLHDYRLRHKSFSIDEEINELQEMIDILKNRKHNEENFNR